MVLAIISFLNYSIYNSKSVYQTSEISNYLLYLLQLFLVINIIKITSPTYFCTSSEPMTLMKQASVRLATARAHSVLPVPGGPKSNTPLGGSMPKLTKRSGYKNNKLTLRPQRLENCTFLSFISS